MQRAFASMAKGRVAQIVTERDSFGKIFIETKGTGDGAGNLADLQCVGQAIAEVPALMRKEHLGLVLQATEGGGMNDAVTVHLKRTAVLALPRRRIALDAFAVEDVVKVVFHRTTLASPLPVEKQGLQGNRKSPSG
jgi:hypothetical protein